MVKTIALMLGLILVATNQAWSKSERELIEALNLKPNMYDGLVIFRVCAKCHNKKGWGQRNGTYPQIAGQHPKVIIKQLIDVRERNRETVGMDHFVMLKIIDDAQALADVAGYISTILMTPTPGVGSSANLEHGKKLYNDYCADCHGHDGKGDNNRFYPRIHGQHYRYLLRQFKWIYRKERMNAHPGMVSAIADFSKRDTEAVIDYISRLKPTKAEVAPSTKWENPDYD